MPIDTQVGIIGAGPAGLVLSRLWDCSQLLARSRNNGVHAGPRHRSARRPGPPPVRPGAVSCRNASHGRDPAPGCADPPVLRRTRPGFAVVGTRPGGPVPPLVSRVGPCPRRGSDRPGPGAARRCHRRGRGGYRARIPPLRPRGGVPLRIGRRRARALAYDRGLGGGRGRGGAGRAGGPCPARLGFAGRRPGLDS